MGPRTTRLFQAVINVTVENRRGVLPGGVEIAEAGSNIDSIAMEEDRAVFTTMHFVLEVANRRHLARVMRARAASPTSKDLARG
jgi:(p)ppGpp synthase/HD superfamily hydrolase